MWLTTRRRHDCWGSGAITGYSRPTKLKTCATCCENCGERLPYQDGFVYAGGVNLFSRPAAGMFIVGYNMAAGTIRTNTAGGSSQPTTTIIKT